jgi:hypothetical protein
MLIAFLHSGCASPRPVVVSSAPVASPFTRLAAADAQVRAGCFDGLLSALEEYKNLRLVASVADAASIGAARSAVPLAICKRELGTEDSGCLARARQIVDSNPRAQVTLGLLLDIEDTLPVR